MLPRPPAGGASVAADAAAPLAIVACIAVSIGGASTVLTFVYSPLASFVVALLASGALTAWLPARRASRISPLLALRSE